tara:strand:+ start:2790 stop:3434 length:645 start_codon:yes stop_codon:yes gene_type:complete
MEEYIKELKKIINNKESNTHQYIFTIGFICILPVTMFSAIELVSTENIFSMLINALTPFLLVSLLMYLTYFFNEKKKLKIKQKIKKEIDNIESLSNGFINLYKNDRNKKMLKEIMPSEDFINNVYLKINSDRLFEKEEYNLIRKYLIILENINHANDINKIHEEKEQRILLEKKQKLREKELKKQKIEYSKVLNKEESLLDKMKFFVKKIKKHI